VVVPLVPFVRLLKSNVASMNEVDGPRADSIVDGNTILGTVGVIEPITL